MFQLSKYCCFELEIKASRFLAEGFPVSLGTEARQLIKNQKAKYKTASHVVHAFSLGANAEILGSSDDGEPAGTSGAPALQVIKNYPISNILVTVTRWFGGTLLGTGGLVKAYSGAVKQLLEHAEIEALIEKVFLEFTLEYSEYHGIKNSFTKYCFFCTETTFSNHVALKGFIPKKTFESFRVFLRNATTGRVNINCVEKARECTR